MLIVLLLLLATLPGCAKDVPPPVLPEDPVVIDAFLPVPRQEDHVEMLECPSATESTYRRRPRRQPSLDGRAPQESSPVTFATLPPALPAPKQTAKPLSVENVIGQANQAALVQPTPDGYFGDTAIHRYRYEPGKVYVIVTHPAQFTKLYFPPGEKPATVPTLNDDLWKTVSGTIGPPARSQAVLGVRPVEQGQRVDMALEMESGRAYFLRFLTTRKYPMLGVTWELPGVEGPETRGHTTTSEQSAVASTGCGGPAAGMHMPVELATLHTGYTIEGKGGASFVPTQVFDDGRKTLIRLKALSGNAPIVFTYKPDGSRGLVQFAPYAIPNDPGRGLYYVVEGIWSTLELSGTDGQSVRITRQTDTIPVASRVP